MFFNFCIFLKYYINSCYDQIMNFNIRFYLIWTFGLLIFAVIFFVITNYGLKKYTLHNNNINVPNLKGLTLEEVDDTLMSINLNYVIIDSAAFDPNFSRGSVLSHNPISGSKVKPGRKIYLTINPVSVSYVIFPNLINKSLRQSINLLNNSALRVGNLYYQEYFARDVLINSKYDGKIMELNDSLPKFSTVDLYLGDGKVEYIKAPDLTGIKIQDLKKKLNSMSLNLGEVHFNNNDTTSTSVFKQSPEIGDKITLGAFISVWCSDTIVN